MNKTWAFKYPHKIVCCSKVRWIGGQRACAPSVDNNGRTTLCAQQLIPGRFAVYTGEDANHDVKMSNSSHTSVRQIQELGMTPHWSTWTPFQGYSHTLYNFRWPDGVLTGMGFNLYGSSLTPLKHPLTYYFSWRCSPTLPIITKFPMKLSLHGYDRLANTNYSTQNMRCCTDQRSIVHWIQVHTEPNHRCQRPLPQPVQALLPNQNG